MISAELSYQRTGDIQISGLAGGESGRYRCETAVVCTSERSVPATQVELMM
jgi:hypothetical protein